MAITLVSTVTVGSGGASSIQFNNIPQTGKDLLLLTSLKETNGSDQLSGFLLQLNGSSSGFTSRWLKAVSTSVSTGSTTLNLIESAYNGSSSASSNLFGNGSLYITNYAGSTGKTISAESVASINNSTAGAANITAANWNNTAAITSLSINFNWVSFTQHSVASLYIIS